MCRGAMVLSSQTFCDSLIMKLKLPNWGSLCNPNLLTNSDFKSGIINQKGQTTYDLTSQSVGGEFTIDMWYATKLKVIVYDNYIRIENSDTTSHSITSNNCSILKNLVSKYTFYANVKKCSDGCYMWFYDRDDGTSYTRDNNNLVTGDNIWTYTISNPADVIRKFGFSIPASGYLELYQCKMEEGSYFTGMPVYDMSSDAFKCLWYSVITDLTGYPEYCNSNQIAFLVPIQRRMIKTPSIVNNVENQSTGISVRKTDGTVVTGFTYEVNYMFKNTVRVIATKNNHGLKFSDIGCIAFRGISGFDANEY